MITLARSVAVLLVLSVGVARGATDWSVQDYNLYSGDFDGDGRTDILYVAKDPAKPSGIARSDGTSANIPWQTWPSNYLGIPWSQNQYQIIVADFNGDSKADVFMQSGMQGDNYLLLTDANGKLSGISEAVSYLNLGIDWSATQHRLVAADFSGDGKADLFFQATSPAGLNAVVVTGPNGLLQTTGSPTQSWSDGYLGFKWSTKNALVYAGNFDGDAYGDLLIQAKPKWVTINYDVAFPVPTYPPNLNGIVYGQGGATPFGAANAQAWSRKNNGVDWSPLTSTIIVGNFNGDTLTDIVLQGRYSGRTTYLIAGAGRSAHGGLKFDTSVALTSNVPITSDVATLLGGNFGAGNFYVQSTAPSGTNYTGALSGAVLTGTVHDPSKATTTAVPSAVGRTVGTFGVSNMGAASYSVPVVVPPGVSGVQPHLAINYQSGGGNGLLGVGWGVSGLSEIERCRKTLVQDGVNGGINFNSGDAFCLDGNRLRSTGGVYGADLSTYQTENETFARVTAHSSAGSGPASFTVEAKDGLTYEYGGTGDSRIESTAPGFTTSARVWALNKVTDRYGNTMTVTYQEDGAGGDGSFRPLTIAYTTNSAAGIAAAFKVSFVWEIRPGGESSTQYVAGGLVRERNRLKQVVTYYNNAAVRSYNFTYNVSGTTPRSRLNALQECDGTGYCLSPTTFGWQDGLAGLGADNTTTDSGSGSGYTIVADVNGDGRTDLVYPVIDQSGTGTWWIAFANASGGYNAGVATSANSGILALPYQAALPMDYDSDGRMDILLPNNAGTQWQILRSTGTNFTTIPTTFSAPSTNNRTTVADVNGDGRQDVVYLAGSGFAQTNVLTILFNSASGLVAGGTSTPLGANTYFNTLAQLGPGAQSRSALQGADFNGDGLQDLVVNYSFVQTSPIVVFQRLAVLVSTGSGYVLSGAPLLSFTNDATNANYFFDTMKLADFNGDGITDVLYQCTGAVTWCVRFGTGAGIGSEITTTAPAGSDRPKAIITDWTGDGRADVMEPTTGNTWQVIPATGDPAAPFGAPITTALSTSGILGSAVADINGDGLLDLLQSDSAGAWHFRIHKSPFPDLVNSVSDGFGNTVAVQYLPLTDSTVYSKAGTAAIYPEMDIQAPLYVVKSYTSTNGLADGGSIAGRYTVSEVYGGARVNLRGRGFEGFGSRTETDGRTGASVTTTFNQVYPRTGSVAATSQKQNNGKAVATSSTTYTDLVTNATLNNERHFVYADTVTQDAFEVNAAVPSVDGGAISRTVTATTVDSYGTPVTVTTRTYDTTGANAALVMTSTTVNNSDSLLPVQNDLVNWCLGFIQKQIATNVLAPNATGQTRTTQFVKDTTALPKCRPLQKIVEPGSATLALTTQYGYDLAGHVNSETVSGPNMVTRLTTTSFGPAGVFPETITNAENEPTYKTYDYAFGVVKTSKDSNGVTLKWDYDGFGRKSLETRPDGTKTSWTLFTCSVWNGYCGDSLLRYQVLEQVLDSNGALVRYSAQMFDAPGRVKYSQSQTVTGAVAQVTTNYDSLGRVYQKSAPYFGGAPAYLSSTQYDVLSRPVNESRRTSESNAAIRSLTYSYERLLQKFTDANSHTTSKTVNALGQVVSVTDALAKVTQYGYDEFGNLTSTKDAANNQILAHFNVRGFKDTTTDPDMGFWSYTYYPTGELWTQTDAKSQVSGNATVTFTYDRVGRKKTRIEAEGTTSWTYGTLTLSFNVGLLTAVTSSGGYQETYTYDSLERPQDITTTADGTAYVVSNTYHPTLGSLQYVTYPTSTAAVTNSKVKVEYVYSHGQLQTVRDGYAAGSVYWQANDTDAAGRIRSETFGNGVSSTSTYDQIDGLIRSRTSGPGNAVQNVSYQWDPMGNLNQRQDLATNLTESFIYDALNRVNTSTLNGVQNLSVTYDAAGLGNILTKTGMSGSYDYTTNQVGCTYTGLTAQPHAVRNAGGVAYCYDMNGNMISRGGQATIWYSYNLPNQINKTVATYAQFWYGAGRNRYKQVSVTASGQSMPAGTETTIYVGGLFQRVTKPSGVVEYQHTILAGSEAVAIKNLRSTGVNDVRYLHKDHLGGVDTITKEAGVVVTRLSYDAYGKRRDAGTWAGTPGTTTWTTIAGVTHRGFTYHEHLDNVDLIHMNGRVYDPVLGRFLSADSIIQAPLMSQSLNRYSYVMNNPLSAVDPSGNSWLSSLFSAVGRLFKNQVFRIIVAVAVAVFLPQIIGTGFWQAVATGALAGGIATGNLKGVFLGGLTAGLFYGAGSWAESFESKFDQGFARVIGHAGAGCLSAVSGGGSCGRGALSAGFGLIPGPSIKSAFWSTVEHGMMGGIGSTLGGGQFGDGFYQGAAGEAFNRLEHDAIERNIKAYQSKSPEEREQIRNEFVQDRAKIYADQDGYTGRWHKVITWAGYLEKFAKWVFGLEAKAVSIAVGVAEGKSMWSEATDKSNLHAYNVFVDDAARTLAGEIANPMATSWGIHRDWTMYNIGNSASQTIDFFYYVSGQAQLRPPTCLIAENC